MTDHTDRIERIREKAREAAQRSPELLREPAGKEPALINQTIGFEYGYLAAPTYTDEELDRVARVMYTNAWGSLDFYDMNAVEMRDTAETALRAFGARREGEE